MWVPIFNNHSDLLIHDDDRKLNQVKQKLQNPEPCCLVYLENTVYFPDKNTRLIYINDDDEQVKISHFINHSHNHHHRRREREKNMKWEKKISSVFD